MHQGRRTCPLNHRSKCLKIQELGPVLCRRPFKVGFFFDRGKFRSLEELKINKSIIVVCTDLLVIDKAETYPPTSTFRPRRTSDGGLSPRAGYGIGPHRNKLRSDTGPRPRARGRSSPQTAQTALCRQENCRPIFPNGRQKRRH
jgi:hypothetical protein